MKRSEMLDNIKKIIKETCDVKKGPRLGVALKILTEIEKEMIPPSRVMSLKNRKEYPNLNDEEFHEFIHLQEVHRWEPENEKK